MVFDPHFIILVMNDSLDESLNSKLEISGGKKNVSSDVVMNAGVLLKKILNWFTIYPALLMPSNVVVGDIMITQECSKILRVPDVCTFLQYLRHLHFYFVPFVST